MRHMTSEAAALAAARYGRSPALDKLIQACHDDPANDSGQVRPESTHLRTREVARDNARSRSSAASLITSSSKPPQSIKKKEVSPPPPPPRNETRYSNYCSYNKIASHRNNPHDMHDDSASERAERKSQNDDEHSSSSRESSASPPMWGAKSNKSATQHLLDLTREERLHALEQRLHVLPLSNTAHFGDEC